MNSSHIVRYLQSEIDLSIAAWICPTTGQTIASYPSSAARVMTANMSEPPPARNHILIDPSAFKSVNNGIPLMEWLHEQRTSAPRNSNLVYQSRGMCINALPGFRPRCGHRRCCGLAHRRILAFAELIVRPYSRHPAVSHCVSNLILLDHPHALPDTSNCKRIGHFSIENRHFSGAILHSFKRIQSIISALFKSKIPDVPQN